MTKMERREIMTRTKNGIIFFTFLLLFSFLLGASAHASIDPALVGMWEIDRVVPVSYSFKKCKFQGENIFCPESSWWALKYVGYDKHITGPCENCNSERIKFIPLCANTGTDVVCKGMVESRSNTYYFHAPFPSHLSSALSITQSGNFQILVNNSVSSGKLTTNNSQFYDEDERDEGNLVLSFTSGPLYSYQIQEQAYENNALAWHRQWVKSTGQTDLLANEPTGTFRLTGIGLQELEISSRVGEITNRNYIRICPAFNDSEQQAAARVKSYLNHHNAEDVVVFSNCWATVRPKSAEAWRFLGLGNLLLKRGYFAYIAYKQMASLAPGNPHAWIGLGDAFALLRKANGVLICAKKLVSLEPESPMAWTALGVAYEDEFTVNSDYNYQYGDIHPSSNLNNVLPYLRKAEFDYEKALKLSPGYKLAAYRLQAIRSRINFWQQAEYRYESWKNWLETPNGQIYTAQIEEFRRKLIMHAWEAAAHGDAP